MEWRLPGAGGGQGGEMARCGSTGVDISVPQDGNVWEICCTTLCISSTILCCTLKHRLMGQVSYCVFLTTIIFFEGGVSHFKWPSGREQQTGKREWGLRTEHYAAADDRCRVCREEEVGVRARESKKGDVWHPFSKGTNEIGNVQFLKEPLSKGKILCMLMAGDDILSRIVLKAWPDR